MIIRLITLLPTLSVCALGQFFGLATTGDGSQLYFATPLRQKDTTTSQPNYGKLFRIDASGLSLQESRSYQAPQPVPTGVEGAGRYSLSNAYDLQFADVSSDGDVIAAIAGLDCIGDAILCGKMDVHFVTTITGFGGSHDYPDKLHLSANGKWAFGGTGSPTYSNEYGFLVNVTTGEQISLRSLLLGISSFQVASSGRPIANDGTAVFSDYDVVVVLQSSRVLRIPTLNHDEPLDAVIDAGAHTIVYSVRATEISLGATSCPCSSQSLLVADAVTGESTLLAPDGYAPSIADDGQTVLYISGRSGTPQVCVIHIDGSDDRELTDGPIGIARAILSGDGSTAYAVTLGGRLLKIMVASGEIDEVIPRTPYLDAYEVTSTAPGKLTTFTGQGLTDIPLNAAPPLPYSLDNVEVTIQGEPTRILSIQPNSVTVLTPLDATPTVFLPLPLLQLSAASMSPFAGPSLPVRIGSYSPEFLWQGTNHMLAAHEDGSALVTADNPAHPGEVVHAYAVGLGPTSPAVPYGAPAPTREPLARLIAPYQCSPPSTTKEVEILFQGLAPDLAGVYQIDWRVPPDADGDYSLYCAATIGATLGTFMGPYMLSFSGFIQVGP